MQAFAPEFRKMIQAASCFVSGKCEFLFFYYACADAAQWAKWFPPQKQTGDLITEWNQQAERCRNEWRMATEPLSEDDFKIWLAAQLMCINEAPVAKETAWT